MIEERQIHNPIKNQEPRTKNRLAADAVLGSHFSVLLRQALWFRLLLFLGVVVLLSLVGAGLGRGFGADSQSALIAQTVGPQLAPTPTVAMLPTAGVAPITAPALPPVASGGAPTPWVLPTRASPVNGSAWPVLLEESFD